MSRKFSLLALGFVAALASVAQTPTFGIRVPIGGEATDLALDEPRGVLYIADFTASRIERMSLATFKLLASIPVDPHPGSMSLSPDRLWLLVGHYDNPASGPGVNNHLTLVNLLNNTQQKLALPDPPLAVMFGADNQALVVTTKQFLLYNPVSNTANLLQTIADFTANTIPASGGTFPLDITTASVSRSGDGNTIFGVGGSGQAITFRYDVPSQTVNPGDIVIGNGNLGPRVVSLNQDGSKVMVGWIMLDRSLGITNFVPQSSNQFSVGTSLFDDSRSLIYAHIPAVAKEPPVLQILAGDNLTVLERLRLPENTTGKSVFSTDSKIMYSVSDSGVLVLPVGYLSSFPRIASSTRSVLLQGNFCDSGKISRTITISDRGGLINTAFSFKPANPAVTVSPASGRTPATVTVTIDPTAFSGLSGTQAVDLGLTSSEAQNVIDPVKVLFNHAEPNQRGTILEVPGTLVDILADPARDRYYVLRQDNNTLLVFDGSNNALLKTLRTDNVPTTLALSFDNQFLYIGHDAAQTLAIYNLDDFSRLPDVSVAAGNGNVVHSLAVANNRIIATSRDYTGQGHILLIDPVTLTATQPATVGVWKNQISTLSVAAAAPSGAQALVATPDGFTYLYDAGLGDFTVSRHDYTSLGGAYGAWGGLFIVDSHMLDGSLVPLFDVDSSRGPSSGFTFYGAGVHTGAVNSVSPGYAERVDWGNGAAVLPTLLVEAPLLPDPSGVMGKFIRGLTVLPFHNTYVNLSVSGLTLLASNYDAPLPQPIITSVASAADGISGVASGGLISVFGSNFSPSAIVSSGVPLPTVLGNSCVLVNGSPVSLLLVSPSLINAQLDDATSGPSTISIRTPQNVSPDFDFTVGSAAPAVFLNGVSGNLTNVPSITRAANGLLVTPSNPIHQGDSLTIFAAGLGATSPLVPAGAVSPSNPPAVAVVQPKVTLSGVALPVTFAGLVPGQIGVYEIKVNVPSYTPQGLSVPLIITQSGQSQTVNVRVVH